MSPPHNTRTYPRQCTGDTNRITTKRYEGILCSTNFLDSEQKLRNLYFRYKRTQDLKILHNDNYVDVSSSLPIFLQATAAISRLP